MHQVEFHEKFDYLKREMHGELLISRLKELVVAGYVPELKDDYPDWIHLKHPCGLRPLQLWPDGQVVDLYPTSINSDAERTILQPEDSEGFKMLIASTPPPTPSQLFWEMKMGEVMTKLIGKSIGYAMTLVLILAALGLWKFLSHMHYSLK